MTSQRQKYRFYHFCLKSVCLDIFENFFMYASNRVHFKYLQFLAGAYDMCVCVFLCFRRCQNGNVFLLCLSNF